MDDQQRAKELQIATLAESSRCLGVAQAKSDNDASEYWFNKEREAIAALRAAPECPEGFVMVPVVGTPEMRQAAGHAVHHATYWGAAWAAMLAARPQGEKDA